MGAGRVRTRRRMRRGGVEEEEEERRRFGRGRFSILNWPTAEPYACWFTAASHSSVFLPSCSEARDRGQRSPNREPSWHRRARARKAQDRLLRLDAARRAAERRLAAHHSSPMSSIANRK